jgi:ABC-type polysaccharide/polyol phosphate export permease
VVEAKHGWGRLNFKELWNFRHLLKTLVLRDIKSRYRMTTLGPLWFIIVAGFLSGYFWFRHQKVYLLVSPALYP